MQAEAKLIPAPAGMEWRRFECSDCPDEGNRFTYIVPIRKEAHPDASGPLDWCPACQGYLSLISTYEKLAAVRVPREKA